MPHPVRRRAHHRIARSRVERDQVHVRAERTGEGCQLGGIADPVVDAADQRPFDGETPAARRDVGRARIGELRQRIATVDGHQLVAQAVVRRVQRHGQVDRQCFLREAADAGHDPHRRERQVAGREADVAVEPHHRAPDPVVVGQGFPHPHEDDVGDAPRPGLPHGGHHLFHDLALAQVALEPRLARRTELARHGTAGLGRDAHGHAVGVAHEHRLDPSAVVQPPQPLGRLSSVRLPARHLVEGRRQRLGQLAARARKAIRSSPRAAAAGHGARPRPGGPGRRGRPEGSGPALLGTGRRARASGPGYEDRRGGPAAASAVALGHEGPRIHQQLRRTASSCWPNDPGRSDAIPAAVPEAQGDR